MEVASLSHFPFTHRPGHERADGGLEDEGPEAVPGVEEGLKAEGERA